MISSIAVMSVARQIQLAITLALVKSETFYRRLSPPDMRDRLSSLMSFLVTLDDVLHRLFYLYAMPNGRQNGLYLDSPLAAPPHQLP